MTKNTTKKRPKRTTEGTKLVAGFVPVPVQKIVLAIADQEGITVSFAVRCLLEESPRVKRELRAA